MDFKDVLPVVSGKICMVTGGGGSIGSELIRCLSQLTPKKIVIVDIYENGAYDISREIGDLVEVEIASVRDYDKMNFIMSQYRPNIIFHAAAHKHVPFMENNPEEAVKNNIIGTEIVSGLAEKYHADNFVLISTDKAVEPVSIMGASKRCCEMFVYERSLFSEYTKFSTVRFGNVMKSNGSVIPLFERQVKTGIVTVTHPEVARFFMTAQQAVELVLKSLAITEGGEIFVLDMGEEVKILDIAEKVIRDAKKEPYKDVKIEFTRLRQGDKLHEKLFYDFEKPEKTKYDKIMRVSGGSIKGLRTALSTLYDMAAKIDREGMRDLIMKITSEGVQK